MKKITKDIISNSGIEIYQDKDLYSFNLDTILLYNFVNPVKKGTIVDLCSGNGVIGLSLASKTDANIKLIEIQKELAQLAVESIKLNNLENRVEMINIDLKNAQKYINHDSVDLITCNPPYFKIDDNTKTKNNEVLSKARHELLTNLDDICNMAKILLKENKHFYMVHRPERLMEIFSSMNKHNLQPKKIQFVRSYDDKDANLVLIDAIKTVKSASLKIIPDLVIYDENGNLTSKAEKIING
ncbi:tRNA1(Val) (adenine(37)-N6)-methyltransferase [Companilactobacillus metriopterae]|uniref:tRNA1(Val) (adenine(37)-N6)-methyltransferase n=1 Tax=Companilactobacillus metriopterae TaxID=1909267 RepID=UPI00100B63CC|nr:tRNA1(Val) (adenine(37)-N6)-methyltransferase [Companilactobacillus metriopterae]